MKWEEIVNFCERDGTGQAEFVSGTVQRDHLKRRGKVVLVAKEV